MKIKIIKSSIESEHEREVNKFMRTVEVLQIQTMVKNNCLVTIISF